MGINDSYIDHFHPNKKLGVRGNMNDYSKHLKGYVLIDDMKMEI